MLFRSIFDYSKSLAELSILKFLLPLRYPGAFLVWSIRCAVPAQELLQQTTPRKRILLATSAD